MWVCECLYVHLHICFCVSVLFRYQFLTVFSCCNICVDFGTVFIFWSSFCFIGEWKFIYKLRNPVQTSWALYTEFSRIFWHHELCRSSDPEVFLGKGVLKICSKFTGEHPRRNVISIKLLCNFIDIKLRHGCSPVNLLHVFKTPFLKNTSDWLLLTLG